MVRFLSVCFFVFMVLLLRGYASATCTQAHVFVTGETLTAATLNANPAAEVACINAIDSTNIGPNGIYASQLIPTNTTQATFGGSSQYTFPAGLQVTNSSTTGVLRLGGGSSSGTLDWGTVPGSFRFNGGPLVTSAAQSCGTLSGYHVECGRTQWAANCGNGSTCNGVTINFSTAFASTPFCQATALINNSSANIPVVVNTVGTSSVQFAMNNGSGAIYNIPVAYWMCVGT